MRGAEGAVCCSVGLQKQWYFRPLRPAPALPIINKNVYICPAAPAAVGDHAAGPSKGCPLCHAGRRANFQTICDISRGCFRYLLDTNSGKLTFGEFSKGFFESCSGRQERGACSFLLFPALGNLQWSPGARGLQSVRENPSKQNSLLRFGPQFGKNHSWRILQGWSCCLLDTNLGDCERPLGVDSGQVREQRHALNFFGPRALLSGPSRFAPLRHGPA